jgi:hypothetical protein
MTRRLAVVLVTSLVCLAAVPAVAAATYRAFRTPSGKVGCAFYSDLETPASVRCDWRGGGDRAVAVDVTGRARPLQVTDTVLDRKAKVLDYGRTTRFGKLRCTSRTTGVTCHSTRSGHGFTVSVEKRELF